MHPEHFKLRARYVTTRDWNVTSELSRGLQHVEKRSLTPSIDQTCSDKNNKRAIRETALMDSQSRDTRCKGEGRSCSFCSEYLGEVRAKKHSPTRNLKINGLKVTSEPPPTAWQADCLQGEDRCGHPSKQQPRLTLLGLVTMR
ncbi:hypothetical protein J6590_041358 [Homalodisca vitripennis]|nr:hypothetical protein J6590_041358 [Homalodisca vitripennis]